MPRTTLDIDAVVLEELKKRSRREQKTAGQMASELLAGALAASTEAEPLQWIAKPMHLRVDLEDKDALAGALEQDAE